MHGFRLVHLKHSPWSCEVLGPNCLQPYKVARVQGLPKKADQGAPAVSSLRIGAHRHSSHKPRILFQDRHLQRLDIAAVSIRLRKRGAFTSFKIQTQSPWHQGWSECPKTGIAASADTAPMACKGSLGRAIFRIGTQPMKSPARVRGLRYSGKISAGLGASSTPG